MSETSEQSHLAHHGYAIFKSHNGDPLYYIPYRYPNFFEHRVWSPVWVHSLFDRYWHFSLAIVAFYVFGVHMLQRWMRNRKPYSLKRPLVVWNSALALFSAIGFWRFSEEFFFVVQRRSFQDSVCLTIDPAQPVAFWATCFALSKVAELVDTVFLVLRKRPLIFLHWYHHAVVLVYSWQAAQKLTAAGRYFMTMNYCVHAIMYSYYALSSMGIRLPRGISMLVTTLQTTQMLIGVGISVFVASLKISSLKHSTPLICQQSNENLLFSFAIYFTFAILFVRFFISAYLVKKKHQPSPTEQEGKTKLLSQQNGHAMNGVGANGISANGVSKKRD